MKALIALCAVLAVLLAVAVKVYIQSTSKQSKTLVIGIMSARSHFEERKRLRETWISVLKENLLLRTKISYKFIVGKTGCQFHIANRKDEYSCVRNKRKLQKDYTGIPLVKIADHASQVVLIHNCTFRVIHPIIVSKLGLHHSISLKTNVTLSLIDEFTKNVFASVTFNTNTRNIVFEDYKYMPIEPVLLPREFSGSLRVTGSVNCGAVTKGVSIDNSGGSVDVNFLGEDGYTIRDVNGLLVGSFILDIQEIQDFEMYTDAQMSLDIEQKEVNGKRDKKLKAEIEAYDDVLLVDMVDVYRNLPQKVLHFHNWVSENFDSDFVMKVDSDCYVDLPRILETLQQTKRENKTWIGNFRYDWPVERMGKWNEPEYRASEYPAFACGSGYIVSQDISSWLSMNSDQLHGYQGEDTSMGIWLSAIGPRYVQNSFLMCDKTCVRGALVVPELRSDDMVEYWTNKLKCDNPCGCEG